jgi:hypothetical protein
VTVGTESLGGENVNRALYLPDRHNWAPRIGFAWQPFDNSKTVIRSGYGIFYDQTFGDVYLSKVANPPFAEVNLGLDFQLARQEALRCLECANPKCVAGCPVGVKVREFIALVVDGDYLAAAAKIREEKQGTPISLKGLKKDVSIDVQKSVLSYLCQWKILSDKVEHFI